MLWETALLESGFPIEDTKAFSNRVYSLAKDTIDLKESLDAIEEESDEPEEEEVVEEEAAAPEEPDEYEEAGDKEEL